MVYEEKIMKKHKKFKPLPSATPQNPVAKFAHRFNKAQIFSDKTRYQRHNKHKGKEPFPII
jgi:hypothetical protein